ncbi:MAG: helix-turn-helix domain-containing protein [Aggregatilineales bacterium]
MLRGEPWQRAARQAGVLTSRSSAYWFVTQYCLRGARVLDDQRHGRPTKLVDAAKAWLVACCHTTPSITSRELQAVLLERYGLAVSVSQLNRVRAALGVRRVRRSPADSASA